MLENGDSPDWFTVWFPSSTISKTSTTYDGWLSRSLNPTDYWGGSLLPIMSEQRNAILSVVMERFMSI